MTEVQLTMAAGNNAAQGPQAETRRSNLEEAIRLINGAGRVTGPDDEARRGLLREAVQLLIGRRGASARSGKISLSVTPESATLEAMLEELLDQPARRLAVYGTLAPGESNHHLIAGIRGTWQKGWVSGVRGRIGPYPALQWRPGGKSIPVQVLSSPHLPRHWARLDRFEGDAYRRILVPVTIPGGVAQVANLYEGIVFT